VRRLADDHEFAVREHLFHAVGGLGREHVRGGAAHHEAGARDLPENLPEDLRLLLGVGLGLLGRARLAQLRHVELELQLETPIGTLAQFVACHAGEGRRFARRIVPREQRRVRVDGIEHRLLTHRLGGDARDTALVEFGPHVDDHEPGQYLQVAPRETHRNAAAHRVTAQHEARNPE
jgi:hypothetical protein